MPRAGVVAWLRSRATDQRSVTEMVVLGTDEFFIAKGRRPDPVELGATIDRARASAVARRVLHGLGSALPAELGTFMNGLLRATVRPVDVSAAARLNFSSARTLRRHLKNAGFPTPRILITWCRLFHAASLLENPRRSVLNVTLALEIQSPDALRHRLRRHAASSPTEVRKRGLDSLLEAFVERHREGRWGLDGS